MQVHSDVSEADIGEVRAGQKAKFSVDAYDRTFEGASPASPPNPEHDTKCRDYNVVVSAATQMLGAGYDRKRQNHHTGAHQRTARAAAGDQV